MQLSSEEYIKVSRVGFGFAGGDNGARTMLGDMVFASSRGTAMSGGERAAAAFGGLDAAAREEIEAVAARVEKEPDVREDIVASLRARIESGNYNVSGEQIAEMMVRRILADQVR